MSNFSSLENITAEIQSLIRQLNSGKLQMEELETLNSLTRELNERIVILKYKAYEEKVFGVSAQTEMEKQLVSGKEIQNVISHMSDFLTNDSSAHVEEVKKSEPIVEAEKQEVEVETEVETSSEEPAFGFDLFESESTLSFAPEIKPDMETFSETRAPFSSEPTPEMKEEVISEVEQIEEEQVEEDEDPEPAIFTSTTEETIEIEEKVVTETYTKSVEVTSSTQKDIFRNFQGLDSGSRLMSPKIQTLVGAFGLNEKLQCIRELYNGSSDAFNQAIEKLDNETSFEAAKIVLAEDAIANSWDLDSNLVNEFLQKVERRFL